MASATHDPPSRGDAPARAGGLLLLPDTAIELHEDAGERAERSDAVANRRRILQTAERLFARRGVADVNMVDIAKAARVGQGTLYRRFANKGDLCLALMDDQMAGFQNTVLHELRGMTSQRTPYLDQLRWFLDALVHFNERHAPLLCESNIRMDAPVPAWAWQRITALGLLNAASRACELRDGLEAPIVADLLLAPLNVFVFRYNRRVNGHSVAAISAGVGLLLDGLARSRSTPPA